MARPMFYYPGAPASAVNRRELTLSLDGRPQGDARPFALDARKVPLGDFEDDGTVIGVRHTDYTRKGTAKTKDFEYAMPEPELPEPEGTIGPDDAPAPGATAAPPVAEQPPAAETPTSA